MGKEYLPQTCNDLVSSCRLLLPYSNCSSQQLQGDGLLMAEKEKIDSRSITSGWVCGAPGSHMDRIAAAMGAFTCIRSDPVELVDCEKPL